MKQIKKTGLSVSWFAFTLLSAIVITMLNYRAFEYVYNNLSSSNFLATLLLVVAYFCLVYIIFALLFVKYLTKFFMIIFLGVSLISLYFNYFYGVLIDSDMIKNAIETDSKEVLELLNWRLIAVFLLAIVFGWLIAKINIVYAPLKRQILFRTSSIAVALVLFVACFLPFTKTYVPFFRTHNQIRLYNTPFYQFYALLRYYQKNLIAKQEFKVLTKEVKIEDTNKRLLVMVVGETARAENYSLGGYSKNDTNFFTKQESVIYFSQVSSCGTATAISLPCMFSFSKRSEYSSSEYQQNILDVLSLAMSAGGGGGISWLSNNSGGCKGVCARLDDVVELKEDYDEVLLKELEKRLQKPKNQQLIVLHIQGSHGPSYYKRYPQEFERFKPTCQTNQLEKCSQESLVNTYDNTLLYTDFILSKIIALLKQKQDYQSTLLYVSDHGESLGENGIYLHGMPYPLAPKEQTHVPMMFWSNDGQLMKKLDGKKDLEFSHDNIFHTILGYFKVKTPIYDSTLDLLSN